MAEVDNPGFETANALTAAFPDAWTFESLATSFDWALYGSVETVDAFEHSWLSNEDRLAVFDPGVDLEEANYDTAAEPVEDFEEDWLSNQNRKTAFALSDIAEASYDSGTPEDQEDFEEEWLSNEDRKVVFVGVPTDLEEGTFDSGTPEEVEDFEEEWSDNEDRFVVFVGVPTDLEDAVFQDDPSGADVDDFEPGLIEIEVKLAVDIGAASTLDSTHAARVSILAGTYDATFEIQAQRKNSSAWEIQQTVVGSGGADPGIELELAAGLTQVRIETTAYTSGTPKARLNWPLLP